MVREIIYINIFETNRVVVHSYLKFKYIQNCTYSSQLTFLAS